MNKNLSEAAAEMGRKGGKSRSPKKLAAIAENAKRAGRPRTKEISDRDKFIADFKSRNPIRDCFGCGNGRYKWVRYLDGIDMRYGYDTLRKAQLALHRAAVTAWDFRQYDEEEILAPCGHMAQRRVVEALGECNDCADKRPL